MQYPPSTSLSQYLNLRLHSLFFPVSFSINFQLFHLSTQHTDLISSHHITLTGTHESQARIRQDRLRKRGGQLGARGLAYVSLKLQRVSSDQVSEVKSSDTDPDDGKGLNQSQKLNRHKWAWEEDDDDDDGGWTEGKNRSYQKRNLQGSQVTAIAISPWPSTIALVGVEWSPTGLFATGLRMFLLGTFRGQNLWGGIQDVLQVYIVAWNGPLLSYGFLPIFLEPPMLQTSHWLGQQVTRIWFRNFLVAAFD